MPIHTRPLLPLNLVSEFSRSLSPGRRTLALLITLLLYTQTIVPPSVAASLASTGGKSRTPPPAPALRNVTNAPVVRPAAATPAPDAFGVVLTALSTAFNNHAGIDYHEGSRQVIVSANAPSGQPHNFELIDGGGAHQAFSNINGLGGALKFATARDGGQGATAGGFRKGETFTTTGAPGVIARLSPDGATVQNPWIMLPAEAGELAGLHLDRTGSFGGDLFVVTDAGGVWRINPAGAAALVASLNTPLSGVTTIPDDAARYGPWAGKILVGAKQQGGVYAVDAQGGAVAYALGLNPAEVELVPAHENFFGLDPAGEKLWGAPADAFTSMIGDVLVAQGSPGILARVRWNGTEFETGQIAQVGAWSQITFAPAGVAEIRGVKGVYDKIAVVRHAPVLNSGRVEGALWQLSAENVALGGTDTITSDLLVPGSPTVTVAGGQPTFAGVIEGVEDAQPAGYSFSIGANASLRHLITRTNPIALETVAAPPSPAGTRDVSITKEGESIGDISTLRNLSLSGKAGAVSVPPGTYGSFSLSGRTILVLGVENSTEPTVYNLQSLSLAGGSELRLAGAVTITVKNGVSLTGSTVGAADAPRRMLLKVAGGDVKTGGNSMLYGVVRAPHSLVEVAGRSRLRGTVACDRLIVSGNGILQITESDIKPPPVNRPPTADAGADQSITLPADTISLSGVTADDGLPQGGTLNSLWTKLSGPGAVAFADAANPLTTATFTEPGLYTLRLRASDSLLTSDDVMSVEVVARNQPPTVNAGADQTIQLPETAALSGAASDDALPRGSTLTTAWSVVSSPGAVTFASPDRTETTASFTVPGTYVLRLTANDTEFSSSDEIIVVVNAGSTAGRVYTLNADFDEGSYINVTHDAPDQLQLDETARTLNFIWVAVSSKGTVVKIDTETGAVLGEYLTSPEGQPRNPSRTTVDQNGNVWATNRNGNSVLHIGLVENGQCVDRNNNGVIDTSAGYGDIRLWTNAGGADTDGGVRTAQDECIIHYTKVNSSGTRHVSVNKDNDVWVSGTGGQRFDLIDGKTGLIKRSEPSVGYGGYGGLIDKNGVIWSSRYLLRWDTSKPLTGANGGNWKGYGHDSYGLCIDSKGNVWNTSVNGNQIHKFAPDGTLLGSFQHGDYWAQGCVVDKNDDVWVAHSLYVASVGHLKNNGVFVGKISLPSGPTGVAVDAKGKIWTTNHNTNNVSRIDPNLGAIGADGVTRIGAVDFTSRDFGGNLYNYSDMTGSTLTGAPDQGTWSTIFDSQTAGAQWGRVGWTAKVCGDGLLSVSVASSEDGTTFGQPLVVSNGDDPEAPAGRYLKVIVRFERASSGESPVLYDLSVGMAGFALETAANVAPEVDAGTDQTIDGVLKTTLRGTACDDALPSNRKLAISWSKLSGPGTVTFARPNSLATEATFSVPGTYELKLTADDAAFTRSDTVVVEVVPGNKPPVVNAGADQAVTHPNTAALNGIITDDGLPRGGALLVTWSKVSGAGGVSFSNPNAASTTARFGAPGAYVLRLTASDSDAAGHDDVTIMVGGENQPPAVNAGTDQTITLPNTAALSGTATDDGWPEGTPLAVTWSVVSAPGTVNFSNPNAAATSATFSAAGSYVLRLAASDSVLSASDEISITVNPAVPPPVVSIDGLPDGAEVTTRVNVAGTVSAGSNWRLEYSLGDGGDGATWMTLASGNTAVAGGLLGVFDPTLLLNGLYTMRLVATDAAAQTTVAAVSLIVRGEQKIGNFSLFFNDLNVPVAGLPIWVTRTYDSRDKQKGDFGIGWTLGLRNVRIEKSGILGADWQQTRSGGFIPAYCLQPRRPRIVTLTFPDNKVYKFQAATSPQCASLVPIQTATMTFVPLAGTHGSLAALGDNEVLVSGDAPGAAELRNFDTLELYNPTRFQFTAEDGTIFIIEQNFGVRSITDTNGNVLNVNADGITHSSGKSISFTRDAQGRITRITDPAGNALNYAYDAGGDLLSFTDRENNTTTFTYDSAHRLLTFKDPRGIQPLRNEYDEGGRLVRQIDAQGKIVNFSHELSDSREVTTDRLGHVTVNEYDERGNIVRVVDSEGGVTTRTFDANDNMLTETNALGQTKTYTYDALDNRRSATDPLGATTRYTYNANRQALTVTDPQGRVTTNSYDPQGNLTSTRDALGNTTTATYDSRGQRTSITDPLGQTTSFQYDSSGNLTKETDALGRVVTYTYDANNNKLAQAQTRTLPGGEVQTLTTSYEYDRQGRVVKTINPDGTTVRNVYNNTGQPSAVVDHLGRRVECTYDATGRSVLRSFPDGTKEESAYDAEGRRTKRTDAANRAINSAYDALGRLVKVTYPDNTSTATTYDAAGRVASVTDARGNVGRFEYDAAGRRIKAIDPLGKITTFAYDASGNQTSMTDAKGQTTRFEYNARNQPTKVIHPDGSTTTKAYDSLGREIAKTDQAGKTTRFEYDALDRLTKVTDALGKITTYAYDEMGWLSSQTDANNHTTRFEYDQLGRRIRRTLPLGMSDSLVYDANNNVVSRTDFRGKTTTFTYDSMNRLLSKTPDASLNEPPVTFTYTVTGQRASMTDLTGTTTYQYDSRDRLVGKATPFGKLTYAYDAAGNVASLRSSNAGGVAVNYTYDTLNRLSQVEDERTEAGTSSYTYDDNGNLASAAYANGVQTTYTYNSLDRLTNLSVGNGSMLASYAYTLGAAGNRLSVTEHDGRTVNYTYDALYRLTEESISGHPVAGVITHTYDDVGNRLARASTVSAVLPSSSTYDANDRLTSDTYDLNGNTTASGASVYSYNFEDKLTGAGGGAITYTYDGDGNRVARTVGGVTTKYLVDDRNQTGYAQVVEEMVGESVVRTYTYGHDLISQNQLVGGAWTQSFYGYDGHGSVRFLTNAAGAITDTYTYDAFGNLIYRTGSTPNEYLYAGERYDANVGFYYLRARYMNPDSGRFHTMDTFEGDVFEPLTLHKYLYAGDDPANKIDPSGEMFKITELQATFMQKMLLLTMLYPRVTAVGKFVVDAMLPLEVSGSMAGSFSAIAGVGVMGAMASKELPLLRRALERVMGIGKLKVGTDFESAVGVILNVPASRLAVRGGQALTGGSRKGAAILDFIYDLVVIEVKTSGGALKRQQARELAKYALAMGQDLGFIFLKQPTPAQMNLLKKWIAEVAPNLSVTFTHLYP